MGSLDDPPPMRPREHIFVASKAPWYEIPDDLPRYDAGPPLKSPSRGLRPESELGERPPARD